MVFIEVGVAAEVEERGAVFDPDIAAEIAVAARHGLAGSGAWAFSADVKRRESRVREHGGSAGVLRSQPFFMQITWNTFLTNTLGRSYPPAIGHPSFIC